MSAVLTVTAKGQVTLRKEVLHHLGVSPGQKVEVNLLPDGQALLRAAGGGADIRQFIGCLEQPDTKPLSIEEMNDIAAGGWMGAR